MPATWPTTDTWKVSLTMNSHIHPYKRYRLKRRLALELEVRRFVLLDNAIDRHMERSGHLLSQQQYFIELIAIELNGKLGYGIDDWLSLHVRMF